MALQIILNLLIAVIWMFFFSFSIPHLLFGYFIGTVLLFILSRFLPSTFYLKRVWALIVLNLLFVKELIMANLDVLRWVYKPKLDMQSGILALPTELENHWEITLLANLITLTPGTLSIDISDDNNYIYVHAIDLPDVNEAIHKIKGTFEKAIMEVSK